MKLNWKKLFMRNGFFSENEPSFLCSLFYIQFFYNTVTLSVLNLIKLFMKIKDELQKREFQLSVGSCNQVVFKLKSSGRIRHI